MLKHMLHKKYPPSTDLWVCIHDICYPDLCEECNKGESNGKEADEAVRHAN